MWFLAVIPKQVTNQALVEFCRIIKLIHVIADILSLYKTIEVFYVAIGLWVIGIVPVMNDITLLKVFIKMFGKFTAVISLNRLDLKRGNYLELLDKIFCRLAREGFIAIRKGKSSFDIYSSDDVSFSSRKKECDSVYLNKIAWVFGVIVANS
jgi:hypothetical protein